MFFLCKIILKAVTSISFYVIQHLPLNIYFISDSEPLIDLSITRKSETNKILETKPVIQDQVYLSFEDLSQIYLKSKTKPEKSVENCDQNENLICSDFETAKGPFQEFILSVTYCLRLLYILIITIEIWLTLVCCECHRKKEYRYIKEIRFEKNLLAPSLYRRRKNIQRRKTDYYREESLALYDQLYLHVKI